MQRRPSRCEGAGPGKPDPNVLHHEACSCQPQACDVVAFALCRVACRRIRGRIGRIIPRRLTARLALVLARLRLRLAERALQRPFAAARSLQIDRALEALEQQEEFYDGVS